MHQHHKTDHIPLCPTAKAFEFGIIGIGFQAGGFFAVKGANDKSSPVRLQPIGSEQVVHFNGLLDFIRNGHLRRPFPAVL